MRFSTYLRRLRASLTSGPRGRLTNKTRPSLALEALEDRWVPATLKILNGVVTFDAAAGVANNLTISQSGTTYTFRDTAETITVTGIAGATGSGTNTVTIPAAQVQPSGIRVNLGDKADALSVESTVNAINVKGGADNDTIDVGRLGGALSAVQAAVTVDGEAGTDTLRVNDPNSGAARTYTVTATKVTPTGGSDVNYAGVENLTVSAGALGDTFNVRGTAAGTTTTLNAGAGLDTFNVGSTANTLDDIKGPLNLNGGTNSGFPIILDADRMNLFDQGSTVARTYAVTANSVARSGAATISYREVENLALNAGAAADTVAVQSTSAATTLNLGGGNDRVTLGNAANSLDDIRALVTVNGEAGTDTIAMNDQGDGNANAYVVTAADVSRNGGKILSYATSESLTLNAGAQADTVNVQSTLAATPVTLKMGGGNDVVNVGSATNSLDPILGALTVDGQAGTDSLTLNDQGETTFNDYTVTATAVSRVGAATVTYAGTENLTINAGSPPIILIAPAVAPDRNRFAVKSTSAATTINSPGFSLFTVGNDANSLDDIRGALAVNSDFGTLVLNDQGDGNANSYTVTSTSVARAGAALISYDVSFNNGVTINAGAFNDTAAVRSTSTDVALNMGAGNDTVTLGGGLLTRLNSIVGFVSVNGQGGADAIVLNDVDQGLSLPPVLEDAEKGALIPLPGGSEFRISSTAVSRRAGSAFFTLFHSQSESLEVRAGSGNDTFKFHSTAAATPVTVRGGLGNDTFVFGDVNAGIRNAATLLGAVTVDGQGGSDTLDYAAFNVGVRANLAAGTATGIAGGVSNVENVTGGSANDILVGNDLANVLKGGAGRDILIGRGGADRLLGEAGDDIVIGAATSHDLAPARLEDVMREWGRTDLLGTAQSQYSTRINHLLGVLGGGLNGTTRLDLSQITDDGAADSLDGGADLDWFFKLGADTITALGATERVN